MTRQPTPTPLSKMTTKLIALGAINKHTGDYTTPVAAVKGTAYSCPDCAKDLMLCKGEVRAPHFRHFADTNPCTYYSKPTESQIHNDAKLLIKRLFESRVPVTVFQTCAACGGEIETEFEGADDTTSVRLEYRFPYKEKERVADVAIVSGGAVEPAAIFEIYKTHKTDESARPEPWFELDAPALLTMEGNAGPGLVRIPCIRRVHCDDCREAEKGKLAARYAKLAAQPLPTLLSNEVNFDFYVRYTLGQRDFKDGIVIYGHCICGGEFCYGGRGKQTCHMRLDFDARDCPGSSDNYKILNLFKDKFSNYNVKLETHKGGCAAAICNPSTPLDIHDYCDMIDKSMPSVSGVTDYCGEGTVDILKSLIRKAHELNAKKQKRIAALKNPPPPTRSLYTPKYDIDDDADMYRFARHQIQDEKRKRAVKNMIILEENDIAYTENNHVATIINPVNDQTLRFSLVKEKTFYNGKWVDNISLRLIIKWYNIDPSIIDEIHGVTSSAAAGGCAINIVTEEFVQGLRNSGMSDFEISLTHPTGHLSDK